MNLAVPFQVGRKVCHQDTLRAVEADVVVKLGHRGAEGDQP